MFVVVSCGCRRISKPRAAVAVTGHLLWLGGLEMCQDFIGLNLRVLTKTDSASNIYIKVELGDLIIYLCGSLIRIRHTAGVYEY